MTKSKTKNAPATMQDLLDYTSATLSVVGVVMARTIPLFARFPLTSTENFDALRSALKELSTEFGSAQSAFAQTVIDGVVDALDVQRGVFEGQPSSAA